MKNEKLNFALCTLFFIVLAAITFRCAWGTDMVFSGSDENFGIFNMRKQMMPEYLTGFYKATPILGQAGSVEVNMNHLITLLFPVQFANDFRYVFFLLMSSFSLVWFLRLRGRSWVASVSGALVGFWFGSVMLAAGGHIYKMAVLSFMTLCLCFVEKSIQSVTLRGSVFYSILAGGAIGVMILEQADVAILGGLFIGAYVLFLLLQQYRKKWHRWLCVIFPLGLVGLFVSFNTILEQYDLNVSQSAAIQDTQDKWEFVTQWSMVPSEWPDLIASGWSGWGSGNPDGPYWGAIGRSSGWEETRKGFFNFKITSVYLGVIPFLLGGFGFFYAGLNRKKLGSANVLFWSIAGVVGFWLAFGKYSILYKLFYQLPLVSNIRAPIKFLDNFQICLGIVAAYGIDRLVGSEKSQSRFVIFGSVVAGFMLFAGMVLRGAPEARIQQFTKMGMGKYAELMGRNMSNAWFHGGLLALLLVGLVFLVWKKRNFVIVAGMALVLILAVDSIILTSHYFRADNIAQLKKGNLVLNYLKENQGNDRIFFFDSTGIYNRWLGVDARYHLLNVFNVWQMPRMSIENKNFLSIVGRNQIRLWEISSVKYITAPVGILSGINKSPKLAAMFNPVMYYRFSLNNQEIVVTPLLKPESARDQVLLEFKGRIPRFSFFQNWESLPKEQHCRELVLPEFDASKIVLLDAIHGIPSSDNTGEYKLTEVVTTKSSAVIKLYSETPGILVFSQYNQPCWKVYLDGKESEVLRCNYLCMGVFVPPGEHVVKFEL